MYCAANGLTFASRAVVPQIKLPQRCLCFSWNCTLHYLGAASALCGGVSPLNHHSSASLASGATLTVDYRRAVSTLNYSGVASALCEARRSV